MKYKQRIHRRKDCTEDGYSIIGMNYNEAEFDDGMGDGSGCCMGDVEDVGTCWAAQGERPFSEIQRPYEASGTLKGCGEYNGRGKG